MWYARELYSGIQVRPTKLCPHHRLWSSSEASAHRPFPCRRADRRRRRRPKPWRRQKLDRTRSGATPRSSSSPASARASQRRRAARAPWPAPRATSPQHSSMIFQTKPPRLSLSTQLGPPAGAGRDPHPSLRRSGGAKSIPIQHQHTADEVTMDDRTTGVSRKRGHR
jgi:hypothetical protein